MYLQTPPSQDAHSLELIGQSLSVEHDVRLSIGLGEAATTAMIRLVRKMESFMVSVLEFFDKSS